MTLVSPSQDLAHRARATQ